MPDFGVPLGGGKPLSEGDLGSIAEELLTACGSVPVWLFTGDLGAGKTTLIKAICGHLGVAGTMSSPTFSIINEYRAAGGKKIYHFDFYRLRDEREAFDIGTDEYFDSGNFCFVEWPDRIPSLIPEKHVEVSITMGEAAATRILQYKKHDG